MVLLVEFRIPLPITVEEYQVAQLFTVIEASKENTKGDTGVEIIVNEPFDNEQGKGQYTHKVYHLGSKVPALLAAILPASCLTLVEKAWNAYPCCRTEYQNKFLKERSSIVLESNHLSDCELDNVFSLDEDELAMRRVVYLDIANDRVANQPSEREPSQFVSEKTGRGNLQGSEWWKTHTPIMCCYKLVTIKFQIFGLQTRMEDVIFRNQVEMLTRFHKDVFCLIDKWYGLTMDDIRILEAQAKKELDEKIRQLNLLTNDADRGSSISIKSDPL